MSDNSRVHLKQICAQCLLSRLPDYRKYEPPNTGEQKLERHDHTENQRELHARKNKGPRFQFLFNVAQGFSKS